MAPCRCACPARGRAPPDTVTARPGSRRRKVAVDVNHQVGVVAGITPRSRRPFPPAQSPHWPRPCRSARSTSKPAAATRPSATPSGSPAVLGHSREVERIGLGAVGNLAGALQNREIPRLTARHIRRPQALRAGSDRAYRPRGTASADRTPAWMWLAVAK